MKSVPHISVKNINFEKFSASFLVQLMFLHNQNLAQTNKNVVENIRTVDSSKVQEQSKR